MRLTRRRLIKYVMSTGAAAAGGATLFVPRKANAYYTGPVSDHFNGTTFFNPGGRDPKGLGRLLQLYTSERWAKWPDAYPSSRLDRPPPLVGGQAARIAFVGHASWLIQAGGCNILIDPVWSDRASPVSFAGPKRVNAPGIAFDDLPPIHAVLVTHNHYDHLDIPTLARIWQRDRPQIVTPLGNDTIMCEAIAGLSATTVDWGDAFVLSPDVRVHAETTQHWSARGTRDRRHALWASFVLETPAGKIYAIGDTGFGDGRTFRQIAARHPRIRKALIPIGAYEPRWFMGDQHMNPDDAVQALEICGAETALGHHWGTFPLTTEGHEQPPADLAKALAARGHAAEQFRAVRPGDVVDI